MSAQSKFTPKVSSATDTDNIWWRLALLISASVVVARLLTAENPRRWTGPLGAWVYNEPGPGPVTTLIFAGLLLLAFCFWLIGCVAKGQMVRWPKWPVLGVLVMSVCTLLAAALAGQKQISTHFAADWISQWLTFLMLLDLLRRAAYRRIMLGAVLATCLLIATKCIYQIHVELPDLLAQYQQNPENFLAGLGIRPGTTRAAQIVERMSSQLASGYFAAGNITASVLILAVMGALGLAGDRLLSIKRKFSVFFGLTLLGSAALMVYAMVLTGSRGAVIGLTVAVLLFAGYVGIKAFVRRRALRVRLAPHYRTFVCAVCGVIVLLSLAVVVCGSKFDSLGAKSLTYRWHYWVGSGRMFADDFWLGVGPGNFKFHYLSHKLVHAVEETANPHSGIIQMFTETGLLGGVALIVCLGGIFIAATKPVTEAVASPRSNSNKPCLLRPLHWLVLLALGAFALRTAVNMEGLAFMRISHGEAVSENLAVLMLGLLVPIGIWAVGYLIGLADSDDLSGENLPATPLLRIAVICGLAGFVLHNQITFALLHGGGGTVFWVFAALAVAMHASRSGENYRLSNLDRYLGVILAGSAMVAFVCTVFVPAATEELHLTRAVKTYRVSSGEMGGLHLLGIEAELERAERAAPSDPWPNTLSARILAQTGSIEKAVFQQRLAVGKSPHDWTARFDLARLLAQDARRSGKQEKWPPAIEAMTQALKCYPSSPVLHENLADMYAEQSNWAEAAEHYKQALDYDQAKKLDFNYQWPSKHRQQVEYKLANARKH